MSWKDTHGVPAPILKGGPGTTQRREVENELHGGVGGYQTEHWDGRQDAEVMPDSISVKLEVLEVGGK